MAQQRKRQKIVSEEKTEEEKALEASLFGNIVFGNEDSEEESADEGVEVEGMKGVLDEHLFFVDNAPEHTDSDSDDDAPEALPSTKQSSAAATAAWADVSSGTIPLTSRTRKLRQEADENSLEISEYEKRLRAKYVDMNPGATSWADKARKRLQDDQDDGYLNSTAGIVRTKKAEKGVLGSGVLDVQRLRDPNLMTSKLKDDGGKGGNGEIKSLAFHPSPKVPILCVASADRRVRLFNTATPNPTDPISTIHIPTFPIVGPSSPLFTPPTGTSLLLTSPSRPYWWIWDLEKGALTKKDINLSANDVSVTLDRGRKRVRAQGGGGTLNPSFDTLGRTVACSSSGKNVHLVDWERMRGGVVAGFKCTGAGAGTIKSIHWVPKSFAPSSVLGESTSTEQNIAVLTSTCQLYIYDVSYLSKPVCVKRWSGGGEQGAGGWSSSTTCSAVGGGLFSVGTNSGYVDIYSSSSSFSPSETDSSEAPNLVKSISNLRTPISSLQFSPDGQLLCMASREGGRKAWRVVHTPTLTTYSTFPSPNNPPMSGGVTSFAFSPGGEVLCAGDEKGRVGMWRIGGAS